MKTRQRQGGSEGGNGWKNTGNSRYCLDIEYVPNLSVPEDFIKKIASGLVSDLIEAGAIIISEDKKECQVIKVEINADSEITVIYDGNVVFNGGVEMHYFSVPTGGYGVGYDIHDRLQRMAAGTPPQNRRTYGVKKPPVS